MASPTTAAALLVVLALLAPPATSACSAADRDMLLSIRAALSEEWLGVFSTWTGTDCCAGWYGVACDPTTGRVADLSLRGEVDDVPWLSPGRGLLSSDLSSSLLLLSNSACANHNLPCADHNLSDATTGQHHANSACANHDLACADHNLAIADHNLAIILVYLYDCINCIMKEAELILEWLRLGFGPYGLHHDLSHGIRNRVFCLIKKYSRADPCSASVATCAVLLGITKESELVCKKLRQDDDILGGENTLSLDICTSALDMLASDMDEYVLKRARIDGFCYRIHFDPASADILTWHEKEWRHSKAQDTELGKVHVDGAHELIKENHATKNKLEEDVTVNGITRGSHELSKENHSTRNKLEEDVTVSGITSGSHELRKGKHSTKKKI
ncbi:unnamed protein product [Miscanthus lutarioriparius]|uniref:Leucine-rich repeat-containing N-terminal plant-type domain-containing protein n=1 Tax=Miscanthus lutarioriparius TaxID=422564 RepID=A0A811MN20_9POAL|nr:unnamed protein product [Miscanthus lutarioriparius]